MSKIEVTAKTVEDAVTEALIQLETTSDKIEYEVIEKGSSGILGIGKKSAVIRAWKTEGPDIEVQNFLKNMFDAMHMEVEVDFQEDKENHTMDIDLRGNDMGILIGKRGQTLDAIQYLVNLVANKKSEDYIRVKVDTENYRKRRKDTLENLARNIAYKVKRTRRSISLEPMNPYERRVIHSALQNDRYVSTHSEGDEPFRHVVVTAKKEK
jgi:spoIIIJ-associated protein